MILTEIVQKNLFILKNTFFQEMATISTCDPWRKSLIK